MVDVGVGVPAESSIHEWESARHWSPQHHHWICMYQELSWDLTNSVYKCCYEYAYVRSWICC